LVAEEGYSARGVASDQGANLVIPAGAGDAVDDEGNGGDQKQHEETFEVGVEVVEPGGEAGEVGGEVRLCPAGEEYAGEGEEIFGGHGEAPY
jgi:hypothetical protein